ncbi:MAG: biotin synthase BioB [Myxococcota bacterium]|jgi:biotin synthase|nr:biotin synthase BioB [Myxococcota bacterium]
MNAHGIDTREALELLQTKDKDTMDLIVRAHEVRKASRGLGVRLCGILNAKSGRCPEDCRFCAQSAHNDAHIDCYPLQSAEAIAQAASQSGQHKAIRFGIVTSGTAISTEEEIGTLETAIAAIRDRGEIAPCASLGNLDERTIERLAASGLSRLHNNIETARSFYPNICSTRPWEGAVETLRLAKKHGLTTCCGGIVGLGESHAQRVELLDQIRDIDPTSVPLNFLSPIRGTRLENEPLLRPLEALRFVAVARLMMPEKEIRLCGGRELVLRDTQALALVAGADGLMVGGYLTTSGRKVEDDWRMVEDAGFFIASEEK